MWANVRAYFKKGNITSKIIQVLSIIGLAALLLSSGAPAMAQGEVTISISDPAEVVVDSDFTTTVDIANVVNFDAGQFDVSFDTSVLRLDSIGAGLIGTTEIPVDLTNEISPGTYRIIANVPGVPGVNGSGYLAVLHFHVIGSGAGSSAIALSNGYLNNNLPEEIAATWIGDSVTVHNEVGKPSPSAFWELSSVPWKPATAVLGVLVGLAGYFRLRRREGS